MRQITLIANWKMYKTVDDVKDFMKQFNQGVPELTGLEIIFCPPFTALYSLSCLMEEIPLFLGAQNMHWEKEGAYTGEISPLMLRDLGVRYVILGHSERRRIFGESSHAINKKLLAAVTFGLVPILCIGETREERLQGATEDILAQQLTEALQGLKTEELEQQPKIIVAYEPVWAIGSGQAARSEDADKASEIIKSVLGRLLGPGITGQVRILYGGSVDETNILDYVGLDKIDGALVGGASLKASTFLGLLRAIGRLRGN